MIVKNARIAFALSLLLSLLGAAPLPLFADHTRRWRQSTYDEFLKGTARGVAVRSDGHLELAPKFTRLADADAAYLWALRVDPKGLLYAAGGSPAKVFRLDGASKPTAIFEAPELNAQAIAFDAKGNLYVATSPDGKVYRVSVSGEKTIFFEPKTKYIWDLEFAADGTLYVATGDKGQIFAVAPDGKSELFYASDEAHIRVLALDTKGNVIAGTEPSGRVLRVTKAVKGAAKKSEGTVGSGEGFVLYETPKREVTALAAGGDGAIYAAAIGEKPRAGAASVNGSVVSAAGATAIISTATTTGTGFVAFPPTLSSGIYRIARDGAPEELWTSRDDVVYSLAMAADNRLLAGTGNNGALLAIDGRGVFAQLAKAESAQITGIARGKDGKIFLCTANPGKVFSVGPEYEPTGTYESRSYDAQLFSQWGRLEWWSPAAGVSAIAKAAAASSEPRLEFYVRSGNTEDPGKEWSPWAGPFTKSGTPAGVPSARFAQWKAVIHDGRPGDGIDWVSLAYLPHNVAPVIDSIAVQEPGIRAQAQMNLAGNQPPNVPLKMPATANNSGVVILQNNATAKFEQPPQGTQQKGYQSVLWNAHDDNDDELRYSVYYRGENEREWKLLKDNLEQKFYAWDDSTLSDGAYYLKIVATDAPSNSPATALRTERESERFEIDNTPPTVEKMEWHGGNARLTFTARDAGSSIERAQYSVDGGDWAVVSPTGKISDAPEEQYDFAVEKLAAGEHTIAVRVYDRFDNVGSAKVTFSVAPPK